MLMRMRGRLRPREQVGCTDCAADRAADCATHGWADYATYSEAGLSAYHPADRASGLRYLDHRYAAVRHGRIGLRGIGERERRNTSVRTVCHVRSTASRIVDERDERNHFGDAHDGWNFWFHCVGFRFQGAVRSAVLTNYGKRDRKDGKFIYQPAE